MAKRLTSHLNSKYFEAASKLKSKKEKVKIIVYVESYDDILFWRSLLQDLENETCYFEVMLPSKNSLGKGKKVAMMNELGEQLGKCMIACVDADYDYLMQDSTKNSRFLNTNPYVFHTFVYSIENYQCYAASLHHVCVMATLNDRRIFDFEAFFTEFSMIIWPLFVWSIWCYKHGVHGRFNMSNFANIVCPTSIDFYHPEKTLEKIKKAVNRKMAWMQHNFIEAKQDLKALEQQMMDLGATPDTTYLFMRGHDLFDSITLPLLSMVCDKLRREREREIHDLAIHDVQMKNELASYRHSVENVGDMLQKHTAYKNCYYYKAVQNRIAELMSNYCFYPSIPVEKITTSK